MDPYVENSYNKVRQVVLNTKEPLVIKNQMNCDLTSWSLKEWSEVLGKDLLKFRCGKNQYTEEPQWESTCLMKEAKFDEFLKYIETNGDEWWYFDYKYLCQWFTDIDALKHKIDWSRLGFTEISSDDSTIWIGSKGAHTSCHMDTYGCNIVLQIFGRKQWILFPPEQNLKPSRIPFEESSIYSKLNFFSPNIEHFKGIGHCHKVILNPGEVLVVPNKWWHYVENLETAISINAWLPLPQDDFQRIKESIATIFVGQMVQSKDTLQNVILNPNMVKEMVSCDVALDVIMALTEKCNTRNKIHKTDSKVTTNPSENVDIEQILSQCKNISKIPALSEPEFKQFLSSQSDRFNNLGSYSSSKKKTDCKKIIDFLEVITDDEVLDVITKKLIEKRNT